MPGFDGTGPVGAGPGTGKGFGSCRDYRPRLGGFRGGGYYRSRHGAGGRWRSLPLAVRRPRSRV